MRNTPPHPLICLLALLFGAPAFSGELDCASKQSALRELTRFVEERREITEACRHNAKAPANNPSANLSGTCERTYKFMNGYVLQVHQKVAAACAEVQAAKNSACKDGQADCLQATADRFRRAAAELEKAEGLLKSAQRKMLEQRELNASAGKVYGQNLSRIQRTIEMQKSMQLPPKNSALKEASHISGADSLRTEGLKTLGEVIKAYELPEDPKAIAARAKKIESAFNAGAQAAIQPEQLGPFAGEQFQAFRRAGEFSRAAGNLGDDLHLAYTTLQQNAAEAEARARRLGGAQGPSRDGVPAGAPEPIQTSLPPPATAQKPPALRQDRAADSREEESDLQLGKLAATPGVPEGGTASQKISPPQAPAETAERAPEAAPQAAREKFVHSSPSSSAVANTAPSAPEATLPLSGDHLVVWYEPGRAPANTAEAHASAPQRAAAPAYANAGELSGMAFFASKAAGPVAPLELKDPNDPIPTLSPDEPVVPLHAPGLSSEREYSLRDEIKKQLKERDEENARSASTLATAKNPDAELGAQDMRYDRRLGGLTPLPAFSMDERETAATLRELSSAFQKDSDQLPGESSVPLFMRVHSAHERFLKRVEPRTVAGAPASP